MSHEGKVDGRGSRGHSSIEDNTDGVIWIKQIDNTKREFSIEVDKLRAPKTRKTASVEIVGGIKWANNKTTAKEVIRYSANQELLIDLAKDMTKDGGVSLDAFVEAVVEKKIYVGSKNSRNKIKAFALKKNNPIIFDKKTDMISTYFNS